MNTVLMILYVALIIINGIIGMLHFRNDRPGLASLHMVCAVLWGVCLVLPHMRGLSLSPSDKHLTFIDTSIVLQSERFLNRDETCVAGLILIFECM